MILYRQLDILFESFTENNSEQKFHSTIDCSIKIYFNYLQILHRSEEQIKRKFAFYKSLFYDSILLVTRLYHFYCKIDLIQGSFC